jgi:hypothetical protein
MSNSPDFWRGVFAGAWSACIIIAALWFTYRCGRDSR